MAPRPAPAPSCLFGRTTRSEGALVGAQHFLAAQAWESSLPSVFPCLWGRSCRFERGRFFDDIANAAYNQANITTQSLRSLRGAKAIANSIPTQRHRHPLTSANSIRNRNRKVSFVELVHRATAQQTQTVCRAGQLSRRCNMRKKDPKSPFVAIYITMLGKKMALHERGFRLWGRFIFRGV
jgi:hypothetical protein